MPLNPPGSWLVFNVLPLLHTQIPVLTPSIARKGQLSNTDLLCSLPTLLRTRLEVLAIQHGVGMPVTRAFKTADGRVAQHFQRGGIYLNPGGETLVLSQ